MRKATAVADFIAPEPVEVKTLPVRSRISYARAVCADHLRYIIGAACGDDSFRSVDRLELVRRLSSPTWLDDPAAALSVIDAMLAQHRTVIEAVTREGIPVDAVTPTTGEYPLLLRASDVFVKYHAALQRISEASPAVEPKENPGQLGSGQMHSPVGASR